MIKKDGKASFVQYLNKMELYNILRQVINEKGEKVIAERIFLNLLDDLQAFNYVEGKTHRHILQMIIADGFAKKLLTVGKWNAESKTLAFTFAQQDAIQTEVATFVFQCLAYGLGWVSSTPTIVKSKVSEKRVLELEKQLTAEKEKTHVLQATVDKQNVQLSNLTQDLKTANQLAATLKRKIGKLEKQVTVYSERERKSNDKKEQIEKVKKKEQKAGKIQLAVWIIWVLIIVALFIFASVWYHYVFIVVGAIVTATLMAIFLGAIIEWIIELYD